MLRAVKHAGYGGFACTGRTYIYYRDGIDIVLQQQAFQTGHSRSVFAVIRSSTMQPEPSLCRRRAMSQSESIVNTWRALKTARVEFRVPKNLASRLRTGHGGWRQKNNAGLGLRFHVW